MAQIKNFENLNIWKDSRQLVNQIYSLTKLQSFAKDYQFIDHIRRTSISIPSNISEGFERDGTKEFMHFLFIAKGSCGELRSQLYIAFDQKYIDDQQFDDIIIRIIALTKSISSLIK